MPIADLERQGFIRPHTALPEDVQKAAARALDELAAAASIAEKHPASAYELAYNAMLFAVTALLYHDGYRAASERHHATLVEYASERLGLFHICLVQEFDESRRKRHRTVYEQKPVSRKEAAHALSVAQRLIEVVRSELHLGSEL